MDSRPQRRIAATTAPAAAAKRRLSPASNAALISGTSAASSRAQLATGRATAGVCAAAAPAPSMTISEQTITSGGRIGLLPDAETSLSDDTLGTNFPRRDGD